MKQTCFFLGRRLIYSTILLSSWSNTAHPGFAFLEGGFDEEGTFFYTPFSGSQSMVEVFRRRVIKTLVQRELVNEDFA